MSNVFRLLGLRLPGTIGVLRGMGWMVGEVTAAELATIPCDATREGEERRSVGSGATASSKVICEWDGAAWGWTTLTPVYSDEMARDAIGAALVAGNNIDITVDDSLNTITVAVEALTLADVSDVTTSAAEVNVLDGIGGITGVVRSDAGVLSADMDVTDVVAAASDTAAGKVELATTAETTTGTDATRAVTPDGLHDMTSLAGAAWFLDEDTLSSNSDAKVPSQQSVKAYVDTAVAGVGGGSFFVDFFERLGATSQWVNMPAAQTVFGAASAGVTQRIVDLTGMTEVLFAILTGSTGNYVAGAFLDIQYSTNIGTPSWTDFNLNLQFGTANNTWANTGWVGVPVGAQGLVLLRIVGEAGNGTADPVFDVISGQFRA